MNGNPTIYLVHALFWAAFILARLLLRTRHEASAAPAESTTASARTAPRSKALLAFHAGTFGVLYWAIAFAVFSGRMPHWMPGQELVATAIMTAGAALAVWSLAYFRSWRLEAKLDAGHQLATGGPFALVRHPIYVALSLLALGSAWWIPTGPVAIGAALVMLGGDLRARAEEKLLAGAFGETYRAYCARTPRFLPGLY